MAPTGIRQSATERRASVLDAALIEFAEGGLTGTSTEDIARRAGISQPYLFRLFPSKKALFIAAVVEMFSRTATLFEQAAGDATGEDALHLMGEAYERLIADRVYLLVQMHAYAASQDLDVRAATRKGFRDLWYTVERVSGLPAETVRDFFATGMLINVVTAMDLPGLEERWAQLLCPPDKGA